jgi:hypothetical protein
MIEKEIARVFLRDFQLLYPMLSLGKQVPSKTPSVDLMLELEIPRERKAKRIIAEVKAEGFPKYLRFAARELKAALKSEKSVYPVVIAPYISDDGRKICEEEGIGFFDLSGNCFLAFNGTYIEVKGNPNRYSSDRKLKSIFKGKSSRISHVLLINPNRSWTLRELAKEASLSVGQVFKVINRLEELDVILRQEQSGIRLTKPGGLLNAWRNEYSYRLNKVANFYSLSDVSKAETLIAEECQRQSIRYALTLFSGVSRIAPFTRYTQVFAYVDNPDTVAEKLSLKKVDSGANIILFKPFDEGVYYGSQTKDRFIVVSNIQLYLDLYNYRGRGEEQAEFLRSQIIKF